MPKSDSTTPPPPSEPLRDRGFITDAEFRRKEKEYMIAVLNSTRWRVSGPGGAAERLGVKLSTMAYRMKVFNIEKPKSVLSE